MVFRIKIQFLHRRKYFLVTIVSLTLSCRQLLWALDVVVDTEHKKSAETIKMGSLVASSVWACRVVNLRKLIKKCFCNKTSSKINCTLFT